MDRSEIAKKVLDSVAEIAGLAIPQINEHSVLTDGLGLGPLEMAELVISIEEDFDISYPEEDWEKTNTVGDIINYVQSKKEIK